MTDNGGMWVNKDDYYEITSKHSPFHFSAYVAVLSIVDKRTGQGSRAVDTLAKMAGMCPRKMRYCLKDLEGGWLDIQHRPRHGGRDLPPVFTVRGWVHSVLTSHKGTKVPMKEPAPHAPSPNNVADIKNAASRMHRGYGEGGGQHG